MPPAPFASYPQGALYRARAEDVYPALTDGSVSLVISDGPYLPAVVRDLDERIASRSLDLFSTAWAP